MAVSISASAPAGLNSSSICWAATSRSAARFSMNSCKFSIGCGTEKNPFEFTCLWVWDAADPGKVEEFAKAGVDQLVVTPWNWSKGQLNVEESILNYAKAVGLSR